MDAIQRVGETRIGKFTDDDLYYIAGSRDRLVGRLEEKYGLAKAEAERRADRWLSTQQKPTRP
jgi:uncharacterized protein YjbJ (UPF0337 family)